METAGSYTHIEMLQVADAVAAEKGIDRETVLDAMEQAIQHAGKRKYGQDLAPQDLGCRHSRLLSLNNRRQL